MSISIMRVKLQKSFFLNKIPSGKVYVYSELKSNVFPVHFTHISACVIFVHLKHTSGCQIATSIVPVWYIAPQAHTRVSNVNFDNEG
jgi:hypothetical protein